MRATGGESHGSSPHLERRLTLFDSVMIVISGTIGPSIFIIPAAVMHSVPDPRIALFLWVFAGGITLLAGLACAELAAMFPEAGGQYVFLREAYGPFPAFLYGWVLFTVGNSSGIAATAIAAALFLGQAFPSLNADHLMWSTRIAGWPVSITQGSLIAVGSVVLLTAINLRSVKFAAWLQNFTALAYLIAVLAIVAVGFALGHGSFTHFTSGSGFAGTTAAGAGVAMIALFYSYDGWEFLSWVGGEIKNPRRNLPLGLILGIALVILTYLMANAVFLYALPPTELASAAVPAGAAMGRLFSADVGRAVAFFIALISFGANSVGVLGGARIYYSMAKDGAFFHALTQLHPRWHTPATSLIVQCVWSCLLILSSSYDQLYTYFIFMMTLAYVMTVAAVIVLRRTQPDRPRPYRCYGYPWLPLLYIVIGTGFVLSTLIARPREALTGLGLAALGIPLYLHWRRQRDAAQTDTRERPLLERLQGGVNHEPE